MTSVNLRAGYHSERAGVPEPSEFQRPNQPAHGKHWATQALPEPDRDFLSAEKTNGARGCGRRQVQV